MTADVMTIVWKEWREILLAQGSRRSALLLLLLPLGILAVYLPLQAGRDWVNSPTVLLAWAWIPLFMVSNVIADAFAGERERHTLETLLASRLSDRAILVGKICAAVGYGWSLTLVALLVGLVTINVAREGNDLLMYSPAMALGVVSFSLLGAALAAGIGVFVSLRAASARQAQQAVGIGLMLLVFIPVLGAQLLPTEWRASLSRTLAATDVGIVLSLVALGMLVLDVALLAASAARFQRTKLIVD